MTGATKAPQSPPPPTPSGSGRRSSADAQGERVGRRTSLGVVPTITIVVVAAAIAIAAATGVHHGPVGPWTVAIVIAVLAGLAGTGRLALPAGPLARHLVMAVVGGGLLLLFSDHVSSFGNFQIAEVAYFLPAVAGLNLLTGLNGQLSLGHGALMAVGAYTVAVLMSHQPHVAIAVVLLAAVVVTGGFGAVVGVAAARLRGPYLAGATLTLAVAVPEVANHYRSLFGGEQGLPIRALGTPTWLSATFPPEKWLAWVGIVVAILTLVLLANLTQSGFGRRLRSVRDDETAAALAGTNVARAQVLAFVVSAACAGLAGGLYGFATAVANPSAFGLVLSLALLTAIVIGGVGSLYGAVWGAIALVFIPHYTDSASKHFHLATTTKNNLPLAIYGLVLVGAMLVFPEGIQGGLRRLGRLLPEGLSAGASRRAESINGRVMGGRVMEGDALTPLPVDSPGDHRGDALRPLPVDSTGDPRGGAPAPPEP